MFNKKVRSRKNKPTSQPGKSGIPEVNRNAPRSPAVPADLRQPPPAPEPLPVSYPGRDTGCGFTPKLKWFDEKLTWEVKQYATDQNRRKMLEYAEKIVREQLLSLRPDVQFWRTGSYATELDVEGSDVDMTIQCPSLNHLDGPYRKLNWIKRALQNNGLFKTVKVVGSRVPVLHLVVEETRIHVDFTIDNDDSKRNTQIIIWYSQYDDRFSFLCRAVKAWASSVGVVGASNGRLNSFTICMMVISYLQVGVSPPIFPCLQELFPELKGPIELKDENYTKRNLFEELKKRPGFVFSKNDSSLGCLFAGFLKYYSEFDFLSNRISIRQGKVFKKEEGNGSDGLPKDFRYIVVEDPFMQPAWNCGRTVFHRDIFERLVAEFKFSFERLVSSHSIFGGLPSLEGRRMLAEFKTEDARIMLWKKEINDNHEKEILENWWVEYTEEELRKMQEKKDAPLYSGIVDPSHYWDKENKKMVLAPWPEPYIPFY